MQEPVSPDPGDRSNFVGQWIRGEREARGWRQFDLAWRCHVPQKDISLYETGTTIPTLVKYAMIEKTFRESPRKGQQPRRPRRAEEMALDALAVAGLNGWWAQTDPDQHVRKLTPVS